MHGLTEHEQDLREHLHPDAPRITDAQHILEIARTTGLPFPSVSRDQAVFFFTGLRDRTEARAAVHRAEAALRFALVAKFKPRPDRSAGSTKHYILSAELPSGLRVDIVAMAEHFDSPEREDERSDERVAVAA